MGRETAESESDGEGADEVLLEGLRRKDAQAYEEFVRRFGGRMLATARRFLPGDQDCDDAVQDAFISAFRAVNEFEGESRLGTWLHRIVVNVCLMKLRSRSRKPEVSIDPLLPTFDETGHQDQPVRSWGRRADEELLSQETRSLVRRCIDQLPDEYRTVLLLRDIEELSTEETARLLNSTTGAIKTRLHRARQALKTLLDPHFSKA